MSMEFAMKITPVPSSSSSCDPTRIATPLPNCATDAVSDGQGYTKVITRSRSDLKGKGTVRDAPSHPEFILSTGNRFDPLSDHEESQVDTEMFDNFPHINSNDLPTNLASSSPSSSALITDATETTSLQQPQRVTFTFQNTRLVVHEYKDEYKELRLLLPANSPPAPKIKKYNAAPKKSKKRRSKRMVPSKVVSNNIAPGDPIDSSSSSSDLTLTMDDVKTFITSRNPDEDHQQLADATIAGFEEVKKKSSTWSSLLGSLSSLLSRATSPPVEDAQRTTDQAKDDHEHSLLVKSLHYFADMFSKVLSPVVKASGVSTAKVGIFLNWSPKNEYAVAEMGKDPAFTTRFFSRTGITSLIAFMMNRVKFQVPLFIGTDHINADKSLNHPDLLLKNPAPPNTPTTLLKLLTDLCRNSSKGTYLARFKLPTGTVNFAYGADVREDVLEVLKELDKESEYEVVYFDVKVAHPAIGGIPEGFDIVPAFAVCKNDKVVSIGYFIPHPSAFRSAKMAKRIPNVRLEIAKAITQDVMLNFMKILADGSPPPEDGRYQHLRENSPILIVALSAHGGKIRGDHVMKMLEMEDRLSPGSVTFKHLVLSSWKDWIVKMGILPADFDDDAAYYQERTIMSHVLSYWGYLGWKTLLENRMEKDELDCNDPNARRLTATKIGKEIANVRWKNRLVKNRMEEDRLDWNDPEARRSTFAAMEDELPEFDVTSPSRTSLISELYQRLGVGRRIISTSRLYPCFQLIGGGKATINSGERLKFLTTNALLGIKSKLDGGELGFAPSLPKSRLGGTRKVKGW